MNGVGEEVKITVGPGNIVGEISTIAVISLGAQEAAINTTISSVTNV